MGYPFAYAYLIAFVGMTVLATLLAVAPSPRKIRVLRTSVVALLAGWVLADFLSSIAVTSEQLAMLARIFAPVWAAVPYAFFSTKGKLGTGLGLASAYGYMQAAGASIEVHSTLGVGTEFLLRFPPVQLDLQPDDAKEPETTPQPARASLTVLLVDDEEGVRRGFSRLLRRRGYRVLEAAGAREAFGLFNSEKVDVLITDIAMPETDGRTLASELRKKRGDLPVLFISGQFREADSPRGPWVAFLAKPFAPEVICSTLEALTRGQPGPALLQPTE